MPNDSILSGVVGKDRSSNIELLRLLSMLMVLLLHSFSGYTHGSGFLQALDFFFNCVAICAVNTFLLISGYFGIRWKLKSLFNLVFQLFYYGFAVYVVAAILGVISFSISGLLSNAKCLYSHWGFITYYLLMYLCAPLLNAFVEKVSNKELLGFIIILVVSENIGIRNYSFLNYCTMYLIGQYISRSRIVENKNIKFSSLYWITTLLIFIFVYASYKLLHIYDPAKMQSLPWGLDYAAPLVILQAVFLFLWFTRLKFYSTYVNWCAASCLSIFLIHMHPAIKEIGYYAYTESLYSLSPMEHIKKLVILIVFVFFGSILIDKIRIVISSLFYRLFLWFIKVTKISNTNIMSYIPNQVSHG